MQAGCSQENQNCFWGNIKLSETTHQVATDNITKIKTLEKNASD